MTEKKTSPHSADTAADVAAYWFARINSGSPSAAEREQFQLWREADPEHEREYRALADIWQLARLLPDSDVQDLLQGPGPRSQQRRRWLLGAGSVCAVLLVGGVALNRQAFESPQFTARYATARGEQRSLPQPDGSTLHLNVDTEVELRYYTDRRTVELLSGEASFEVAADATRPFYVEAGAVSVRVTGTVFNVRLDDGRVTVAVQLGRVEVSSGHWWNRERTTLTAGMLTRAQPGERQAVAQGDVAAVTAWRQGKVVFRDQPLEDMVREMNRYLSRPIILADSRLKRRHMAGVFGIADGDAFLQALQSNLPIAVRRRPDGSVELSLQGQDQ